MPTFAQLAQMEDDNDDDDDAITQNNKQNKQKIDKVPDSDKGADKPDNNDPDKGAEFCQLLSAAVYDLGCLSNLCNGLAKTCTFFDQLEDFMSCTCKYFLLIEDINLICRRSTKCCKKCKDALM